MHRSGCFGVKICLAFLFLFSGAWTCASGAETVIEEVGVVFDLPDVWASKVEKTRIRTGHLLQRWRRQPIVINGMDAIPGIVALVTQVDNAKDSDLVLITQGVLQGEPYRIGLAETECMKCSRYRIKQPEGTVTAISFKPPPDCRENPLLDDPDLACQYQQVNRVNLKLEPSWAFRMDKDSPQGKMKVIIVHALVDGKFLDVSFWYPADLAETVEQEIIPIIGSMRKSVPKQ